MSATCRRLPLAIALACLVLPPVAGAQDGAPSPPAGAASVPRAGKPVPRPLPPQQLRESATAPGELRPEHAVVPQINIPLGRKQDPPAKPQPRPPRSARAASAGDIDDAVARCQAQADRQARAACRARLAREDRSR